jgi:hypothetical protein
LTPTEEDLTPTEEDLRARKCGRCQQLFAGDPALFPAAIPDWWLCPDCRSILLGDR